MSPVNVFLSYNEDEVGRQIATKLKEALFVIHIDAVMARHNIAPGAEWEPTIRHYLEESSALLCVATAGFSTRPWCQQEIGWALGRHAPILWIQYDSKEVPCGFLASQQALMVDGPKDQSRVALSIMEWLAENNSTRDDLADTLLTALEKAEHYDDARSAAELLAILKSLSAEEWCRVERAADNNRQVGNAYVWTGDYFVSMEQHPKVLQWLKEKLEISTLAGSLTGQNKTQRSAKSV